MGHTAESWAAEQRRLAGPRTADEPGLKLTRIWDGAGCICQLSDEQPGVMFDAETGKPLKRLTKKWSRAVERLVDLTGGQL